MGGLYIGGVPNFANTLSSEQQWRHYGLKREGGEALHWHSRIYPGGLYCMQATVDLDISRTLFRRPPVMSSTCHHPGPALFLR